jgi:hypothetical protein
MGLVLNVVLFTVPPWRTARAQLHSDVCTPTGYLVQPMERSVSGYRT